jgi:hypothetical protein
MAVVAQVFRRLSCPLWSIHWKSRRDPELSADFHKYGGIRPSMHPASLRCSSVKYSRYAPSSRLARRAGPPTRQARWGPRAPRRPLCVTVFMKGSTKQGNQFEASTAGWYAARHCFAWSIAVIGLPKCSARRMSVPRVTRISQLSERGSFSSRQEVPSGRDHIRASATSRIESNRG